MHMFLWLIYIAGLTRSRIWTPTPMATLHYAQVFILHRARFRFQSRLPTTGMGSESESIPESVFRNVNESLMPEMWLIERNICCFRPNGWYGVWSWCWIAANAARDDASWIIAWIDRKRLREITQE